MLRELEVLEQGERRRRHDVETEGIDDEAGRVWERRSVLGEGKGLRVKKK